MRIIKYRAYDKKHNEMYDVCMITMVDRKGKSKYGELQIWGTVGEQPKTYSIDHKDCELMQFTGLLDKNGVEIYEGDIVKSDSKYYPINPVIYHCDVINEHDGDWDEWYCGFCLDDVDHTPISGDFEVIGNIYENPELVK